MNSDNPITERNGMFSFMLNPCRSDILAHVLDSAVPFVWIRHHTPNHRLEWWNTQTRLTKTGVLHDIEVRYMDFDLQLRTNRFLELLNEFHDHGLELFQMTQRVPNSLTLDSMAENFANRILIQNGLHVAFHLPHANECAKLASPHREVLEKLLLRQELKEIAY